jgi:hypothetical protein
MTRQFARPEREDHRRPHQRQNTQAIQQPYHPQLRVALRLPPRPEPHRRHLTIPGPEISMASPDFHYPSQKRDSCVSVSHSTTCPWASPPGLALPRHHGEGRLRLFRHQRLAGIGVKYRTARTERTTGPGVSPCGGVRRGAGWASGRAGTARAVVEQHGRCWST